MFRKFAAISFVLALTVALSPTAGGTAPPGDPVKLNGQLGGESVIGFHILGGGDFVAYHFRNANNDWQFYSVPIGGGPAWQMNPPGTEVQQMSDRHVESDIFVLVIGSHFSNEETWAINVREQTRMKIADGPGNETVIVDTVTSADGNWVALERSQTAPATITLYSTDGTAAVEMGPAGANARDPQFTPDSEYLIYHVHHNNQSRAFSYRVSDGALAALGPWTDESIDDVVVSPDSTVVAISEFGSSKVRTSNVDGSNKAVVFSGPASSRIRELQINATGDHVIFEVEASNDLLRSAQVGVAGSSVVLIPANLNPSPASLSPDGQWAVLGTDSGLTSVPVAGGMPITLEGSLRDFSPDSSSLLISQTDGAAAQPALIPIDGGTATPLVSSWPNNAVVQGAVFYPLGGDVLFKSERGNGANLFRVDRAGGIAMQLNVPATDSGMWSYNPAISPDGRYVVYMGGNQSSEQHRLYSVEIGYLCGGAAATMVGSAAADTLVGTDERDVIVAKGGSDIITTGKGADIVCAGAGADIVRTGNGRDLVYGQNGFDDIYLGVGGDSAFGGEGRDKIRGQAGEDTLRGANGDDILFGGAADDTLQGGAGNDTCRGGTGTDTASACESTFGVP